MSSARQRVVTGVVHKRAGTSVVHKRAMRTEMVRKRVAVTVVIHARVVVTVVLHTRIGTRVWYTPVPLARVCARMLSIHVPHRHVCAVRQRAIVHAVHMPAITRGCGPDDERHGHGAAWCHTCTADLQTPITIGCEQKSRP